MAKNGTTHVILGIDDDPDHEFKVAITGTRLHLTLTDTTTALFKSPAGLHNLADQLKMAAEQWDAMEASRADVTHN